MALMKLNLNPGKKVLFQFGLVGLVMFGLIGWLCLRWNGLFGLDFGAAAPVVSWVLWGFAALSGIFSFVKPELNQPIYAGLTLITYPIGLVVSSILMVVLFFGVVTPVALIFKLLGKDPMNRRLDPDASTYWTTRDEPRSTESYFKQF
ncbi:MAG: hypothetical protein CMJ83_14560 [Planctomycetes bacterium]|nr:hypothetical protein [Planctomycetota bacterium]